MMMRVEIWNIALRNALSFELEAKDFVVFKDIPLEIFLSVIQLKGQKG
jgi:hypothetical protein